MSAAKPKIVVRAASAASVPAASVVKTVAKPAAKVVVSRAAPAPKKAAVVVQHVEEAEYEEEAPMMTPAQIIASMEEQLASLRVALKMKGLTKSGKPRKQREYTGPSDKQAAWNAYVQEVREEHGIEADEEGNAILDKKGQPKYAISYKEAMQIAGERRKLEAPAAAAPTPAKTAVKVVPKTAAAAGGVKAVAKPAAKTVAAPAKTAAAAPAVRKSAAELRAEFLAKKAAEAAAAASASEEEQPAEEEQAAEEESNEAVEWEFEGQTYFKTGDHLCWLQTEDGGRIWAGVFLPAENRIDDSVEEPVFE